MLEIMILTSTILFSHNNSSAQTYDTITKQRELSKNNPQIPLGRGEFAFMAVNPSANQIYVANSGSNTVSIIDSDSGNLINIPVGTDPSGIAVSPSTNKIYVANSGSGTVSVIHNDKEIRQIPVGTDPTRIAVSNAYPSITYVLNISHNLTRPNTISVIDGSVDKVAAGITFNIHPGNSGGVWCNNREYPTNTYLYVTSGTKCMARPAKDFEFSSWVENLEHNSTLPLNQSAISDSPWNSFYYFIVGKPNDTSATFDVNRFGTFTANFKPVPPSILPQYWTLIITLLITGIVGWSIPSIIGWIKSKAQLRRANQYHKRIHSLYADNNILYENDNTLDTLKTDIKNAYAEGKISPQQYNDLKDETSILYERAYKSKIDSLDGKVDGKNNRIELEEIKNDITDAYAEGKISEQHYNLLKEKIANFSDTGQPSST
jgi:YVTN family beta-propeller protein